MEIEAMAIEISQFRNFGLLEQLEWILRDGILLAQSKDHQQRSFLYELDGFFVAVQYSEPGEELTSIICFETSAEAIQHFQPPARKLDPACRVNKLTD